MKKIACFIAVSLALGAAAAWAQDIPPGDPGERQAPRAEWGPGEASAQNLPPAGRGEQRLRPETPGGTDFSRVMEELFFPPDLVMRNQQAIGLRDEQQGALRAEMQKSVARFTDLQWQQSAQTETLEALCGKQPVDEKAVVAQFDKLLALETEIKRLHFTSLVRVKNLLTLEQQARLRELNRQGRPRPNGPQRPGGIREPAGTPPGGAPGR